MPEEKELKKVRDRVDTIITAWSNNGPTSLADQKAITDRWLKSVGMVYVLSSIKDVEPLQGFSYVHTKDQNPTLLEVLDFVLSKSRPDDYVILTGPTLLFKDNHSELIDFVTAHAMNRAWGCFINGADMPLSTAPDCFVVSAYILQYMVKDVPDTLNFTTNTWAKWIHEWLMKTLQPNRYFNGTRFNLAYNPSPRAPKVEILAPIPLIDPDHLDESAEAVKAVPGVIEPLKRKRGRPCKIKTIE